jgi:hypothetical protein
MLRSLGRQRTWDIPRDHVRDEAKMTEVASFHGRHHIARHDDDGTLHIYAVTDEHGQPASEMANTTTTYRGTDHQQIRTLADINRANRGKRWAT